MLAKDINPLVDAVDEDIDAMKFHLEDIMEIREEVESKSEAQKQAIRNEIDYAEIWEEPRRVRFEHVNRPCYSMTVKLTPNPKSIRRKRPEDPEFVVLMLTLVRMAEEETDVVVAVNVPLRKGEYEAEKERDSKSVKEAREHLERMWKTFELRGSF